jgi:hypothetical protein
LPKYALMAGKGRPKKTVDLAKLRNLAMIGCPYPVIAAECGISHDTLERNFLSEVEAARGTGKRRVLAKAFQMALKGNARMLELLLVNWCGFSLRPETVVNVQTNYSAPQPTAAEFKARYAAAREFLEAELQNNGNRQGRRNLPSV